MHDNIIVTAPCLADGAGVHTPVRTRHESDFESLGFYEMPQTGRTEGPDGLDEDYSTSFSNSSTEIP